MQEEGTDKKATIKIRHNQNLHYVFNMETVPNSLHVLTAVWGGLCCLDIGFRHIVPPRPGTMINMVTAGYSCLVFFVADESSLRDT